MKQGGFVTLVGAGPGDPNLLTLAGLEALRSAEVILHDRLAAEELLRLAAPTADCIDVGKQRGNHPTPQAEINALILKHAQEGKRVVRLKGGDPYLFGRGAEELELLRQHGIPFRVIPGVTSAIAAPAYAGIPVTHREHSSSLHILTGHGKNGESPNLPFKHLAKLGGTLVFLMGLAALKDICAGLAAAGMDPETPAALVENGTRPEQRRVVGTLSTLPDLAAQWHFASPSIAVVGQVCLLAERFDFTPNLPLWGKRLLVASSRTTSSRLAGRLRDLGAAVDEIAAIDLAPLPLADAFFQGLGRFTWIVLTSRFGAECFFQNMIQHCYDLRKFAQTRFAAVGPETAAVLAQYGIQADLVPPDYHAAALAAELAKLVTENDHVLLFQARDGLRDIVSALAARNISYLATAAYETRGTAVCSDLIRQRLLENRYDAVTFTSGSSVTALVDAARSFDPAFPFNKLPAIAIGATTAAAARGHGLACEVAEVATLDGIVNLMLKKWTR